MELNEIAELKLTKVLPFERSLRECPKCGWGPSHRPSWMVRCFDIPHAAFKVTYCVGNQDIEKKATLVTLQGEVEHTWNPSCAGVVEAHLHLQCTHCSYHFLMGTKDGH
jgi:hypothetical protein